MAGVPGAAVDSSNIGAGRQHAVAASVAALEDPKTDTDIEGAERPQREVPFLLESLAGLERIDVHSCGQGCLVVRGQFELLGEEMTSFPHLDHLFEH